MPEPYPYLKSIRRENGLIENVCEHGVGHPSYGSAHFQSLWRDQDVDPWLIHGCDGCCRTLEWKEYALRNSVEASNQIVLAQRRMIDALRAEMEVMRAEINDLKEELP